MERSRYVLRDEVFGGTLFDRRSFRHRFISPEEIRKGVKFDGETVSSYEKWNADSREAPTNIPFSPIRMYFELTRKCNLSCKTCFNASGVSGRNEMTTIEVMKTLEGLRKDHVFDIRFTGGEVTVRNDWCQLLQFAKDIGLAISVNTNGTYDDPSTIDKLAALNPDQVTISIDGNPYCVY